MSELYARKNIEVVLSKTGSSFWFEEQNEALNIRKVTKVADNKKD